MPAYSAFERSLFVYHLHMGGADADAWEWRSLSAPRYRAKLRQLGVQFVGSAREADVVVVTGLLLAGNLAGVLVQLALMPFPSAVVAAGDAACTGGIWAEEGLPGLAPYPLSHYADVQLTIPGSPPTPQALIEGLAAAARLLTHPQGSPPDAWQEE